MAFFAVYNFLYGIWDVAETCGQGSVIITSIMNEQQQNTIFAYLPFVSYWLHL